MLCEEGQKNLFQDSSRSFHQSVSYISDRGLSCVAAYTFDKAVIGDIAKKVADKQYMDLVKFHNDNPDVLLVYVPVEFELENDGQRPADKEMQTKIDFLY